MTPKDTEPDYDVALSFAGEDRPYVDAVAQALVSANVRVFYDRYETVDLWGKNLYQHLSSVYSARARYCVLFISKWYAEKLWTRRELESAQDRAFRENREYILPVRFDDTELPGIHATTAYIDLRTMAPGELAALIVEKVGVKEQVADPARTTVLEPDDTAAPAFTGDELHAFLRDNRLARHLDQQIASLTRAGRLDGVRDDAMTAARMLGIRTLESLEIALGTHRKLILEWAAESLKGTEGPTRHGESLQFLAFARLSELRDADRLARYLQACNLAHGEDPRVAAMRTIDTYLRLTR